VKADRLGEAYGEALGAPPDGAPAFRPALVRAIARDAARRRRARWALAGGLGLATAAATLVMLDFLWMTRPHSRPGVEPRPPAPRASAPRDHGAIGTAVSDDEEAALLLAAAIVRLEGLGDPEAGRERLRLVLRDHPHSAAAREAAARLDGDSSGDRR